VAPISGLPDAIIITVAAVAARTALSTGCGCASIAACNHEVGHDDVVDEPGRPACRGRFDQEDDGIASSAPIPTSAAVTSDATVASRIANATGWAVSIAAAAARRRLASISSRTSLDHCGGPVLKLFGERKGALTL
jgi:hypothetical protein